MIKPLQISLITPTGARPEAFKLCEQWIKHQDAAPHYSLKEWIVVDDYIPKPTHCTMHQTYLKGPRAWTPEINTQRFNMEAALERVSGDALFIIEDDEYYAPGYLSAMTSLLLSGAQLAGLSSARYYHVGAPGYKPIDNFRHASLCQTALRKEALPLLLRAVNSGEYYFDIDLWRRAQKESQVPCALISNTSLSVGIKGMPGRKGLGAGHEMVGYQGDRDLSMLKKWLGDDYRFYQPFIKR